MSKLKYDCSKCHAYCCSIYERVEVTDRDLKRMAKYFKLSESETERLHTKRLDGERVLRRRKDKLLGQTCKFLDKKTRQCTIYEGRPQTCRDWPGDKKTRCVYFDVLQFERSTQEADEVVPLIKIQLFDND